MIETYTVDPRENEPLCNEVLWYNEQYSFDFALPKLKVKVTSKIRYS